MSIQRASPPLIKTAIVGVGIAGQSHLLDAVTQGEIEVVALVGRRKPAVEEVAHRFGVSRVYGRVGALLQHESLDALVVATPIRVLPFHVIAGLRAGLPVLAEKPLASSLFPLHRMEPLCFGRRAVSVCYSRRYSGAWIEARNWIGSGRIGVVRCVTLQLWGPFTKRFGHAALTHRRDPADCVAGAMLDSGSHGCDAILFLLGREFPVLTANMEFNSRGIDIAVRAKFGGPECPQIELTLAESDTERTRLYIEGDLGSITIENLSATLDATIKVCYGGRDYLARPVDDLVCMVRGGEPLGAGISSSKSVVRSILNVYSLVGRSLARHWSRPRSKAIARTSGAC